MRVKGVETYLYDLNKASLKLPKQARAYSYVGITRTNDPNEALTGIIKYKCSKDQAPSKINVGGVRYYKAGNSVGDYYYYTTTSANASPGVPITDLEFDTVPATGDKATILSTAASDPSNLQQLLDEIDKDKSLKPYERIVKKALLKQSYVDLNLTAQNTLYGHMTVELDDTYITSLYIGKGKSYSAAAKDAIKQGATFLYSFNTNLSLTGNRSANFWQWKNADLSPKNTIEEQLSTWSVPKIAKCVTED